MTLTVLPVPGPGAEDVLVGLSGPDEGAVFTGTADGAIWRVGHDGVRLDRVARTGGRPLGLEWDLDGRLLVCDARRGLLRVDPRTGGIEPVLDAVDGARMRFPNNAAVAADGTIWLSDSSRRFGLADWKSEMVQDTRTGRLLRLDPDGNVEVVLDDLAFANGVALAADESWVAVAQTAACDVVRRWLTGPRAGERDLLCADLPGYPDNIARGTDGLIWVAIASPATATVGRLQRSPLLLRRAATRIPEALQPRPGRTVRAQAYDVDGTLVHDLDIDPSTHATSYHMVTGVREHEGRVWMGSLEESAIAVWDLR